jgi:hypothetical protein
VWSYKLVLGTVGKLDPKLLFALQLFFLRFTGSKLIQQKLRKLHFKWGWVTFPGNQEVKG